MRGETPSKEMLSLMVKCPAIYDAEAVRDWAFKRSWSGEDLHFFVETIMRKQLEWKEIAKKEAPENNPLVKEIIDEFGGTIERR